VARRYGSLTITNGSYSFHSVEPTYHLEDIFGSRGRIAVLRTLANVSVPLSIRQIARQSGLSHVSTAAVLDGLVACGAVSETTAGRSRVHWLNRNSLIVRDIVLPALAAETAQPQALLSAVREALPAGVYSAVLYGSYARGDQTPLSDLDILLVYSSKDSVESESDALDSIAGELGRRLGVHVSVLAYSLEEALTLVERRGTMMDGVMADGIVLAGVPPVEWGRDLGRQTNRWTRGQLPQMSPGLPGQ
jgi:predicted nucleotidyltransferase